MSAGSEGTEGEYSEVADEQLTELEASTPDLYNDVLTVCEAIFADATYAQSMSAAVQTNSGWFSASRFPGGTPTRSSGVRPALASKPCSPTPEFEQRHTVPGVV